MTAFEQIRRDLAEYPADLVNWEAACLKNMANLLDSLERARTEWQSLSHQLTETKGRLEGEQVALDRVARLEEEADAVRGELADTVESLQRERDAHAEVRRSLAAERERAEGLAAELEQTRARLETVRRERDVLAENEQGLEALRSEVASLRQRLKAAQAAELDLREERDRAASLERELGRTRELLAGAAATEAERDAARAALAETEARLLAVENECEEKILLVCDLRVRDNRLQQERDDAVSQGRQKVRKILDRIHQVLDDAGAPRGDDASYGERVRWLAGRIAELEAR